MTQVERRAGPVEFPVEINLRFAHIDHAELDGAAHLLGGESDAARCMHGLNHRGGEVA